MNKSLPDPSLETLADLSFLVGVSLLDKLDEIANQLAELTLERWVILKLINGGGREDLRWLKDFCPLLVTSLVMSITLVSVFAASIS